MIVALPAELESWNSTTPALMVLLIVALPAVLELKKKRRPRFVRKAFPAVAESLNVTSAKLSMAALPAVLALEKLRRPPFAMLRAVDLLTMPAPTMLTSTPPEGPMSKE